MRSLLTLTCAACIAAVFVVAPKPASATPAAAAIAHGETQTSLVEEVGKRYKYKRRYGRNWNRGYYRGYRGYRYRPYAYYRPYRPYRYPYYYRRRPGVGLWFGW